MKRKQWSKLIATVTATALAFTGVVGYQGSLLQVSAENDGTIYVDGCNEFDVYTLHGTKLATRAALPSGVYVVKAAASTAMVVVK